MITVVAGVAGADADTGAVESMMLGDIITVVFYNVKVPELMDKSMPMEAQLIVHDTKRSPVPVLGPGPGLAYMSDAQITVSAPTVSRVTVKPGTATAEEVIEIVRVTYIARDNVFGMNEITIQLPEDWSPAYPHEEGETSKSFGRIALTEARAGTAENSYVVLTSSRDNIGTPNNSGNYFINLDDMNASIMVTVEDMPPSNVITATFYNVKVPPLTKSQLMAGASVDAQLTVKDSKISPDGMAYMSNAQITVSAPTASRVAVTPRTATAESVRDEVTVTYTVKDTVYDGNVITIKLPDIHDQAPSPDQAWGPAFGHTFGSTSDTIDLARDTTVTPSRSSSNGIFKASGR